VRTGLFWLRTETSGRGGSVYRVMNLPVLQKMINVLTSYEALLKKISTPWD
jgi:hypothetical protein